MRAAGTVSCTRKFGEDLPAGEGYADVSDENLFGE